jgi:ABC-type nitrate/sulfonate/bicarbonate transport system permease component
MIGRFIVSPAAAGLAGLAVLLVVLEVGVRSGAISPTVVAMPSQAIIGLVTIQRKVDFIGAFGITFGTVGVALLLEVLVALPVGYALFRWRVFGEAYESWLAALFAAPVFLLYPLFMVIVGRNYFTLIIMGFIPGVIPMIIQVYRGFVGIPRTLIDVGNSFGLSARQTFWMIMVPAAVPGIVAGVRLGLMYTLINIVAIEYLVDVGGLGRVVSDRYFRFDIPGTYTCIIAIVAVSVIFGWLIGRVQRWVR